MNCLQFYQTLCQLLGIEKGKIQDPYSQEIQHQVKSKNQIKSKTSERAHYNTV